MTSNPPGGRLPDPPLLIITDRAQCRGDLLGVAEAAFRGGARWLSLREKDLDSPARLALARELVALGGRYRATVILHEDAEGARAAGAAGVHLPAGGPVAAARRRLGPKALIGVSAHDEPELAAAVAGGADYVTVSPVFPSASKPGYGPALGLEGLRALSRAADVPVLALGGVTLETLSGCVAAGAAGAAVMGPVMRAADSQTVVTEMIRLLRRDLDHIVRPKASGR